MTFFFFCSQRSNNKSNQSLNQELERIFHKDKNCKLTMSTQIKPSGPRLKSLPSLQKGNENLLFPHVFALRAHNMCKSTNFHGVISRIKTSRKESKGILVFKDISSTCQLTDQPYWCKKLPAKQKTCSVSYCANICSQLTLINAKTQANMFKKTHANIQQSTQNQ